MPDDAPVPPETLLAFLEDPASYEHAPASVRVVQTHASYVALAPPLVYKVKKPVDFGFLDFSTLEKRRHFCERELALNRRLCPAAYRDVVPIARRGDALAFGAGDAVVDYAVRMNYLDDEGFLDRRLARGTLDAADLDRVADRLARFYREEPSPPEVAAWGRIEKLRVSTDENFAQTEDAVGTLLSRPAFEAIRYYTDRFYDARALLLNRRRAGGWIRDCHGDLHLEHVHLTGERVCIYDCIEFNERLRAIDVASDVAFLAMDLDFNGRPDLSHRFAARVAERLGDADLPRLLDFYRCYRAYVRGKVEGLRGAEGEVPGEEREASRERARRFFRLALRYAVAGPEPFVLAVTGRVGTGKSTQAEALAAALGWEAVSSDRTRKALAGVAPHERGDAAARARLYADGMTGRTYDALADAAVANARRGLGTVLDATYSRRAHRDALRERLHAHDLPLRFAELAASREAVSARLKRREGARAVVSDARLEDLDAIDAAYEPPDALEDPFHFTTSADAPADETTLDVLRHLVRLKGFE